MRGTKEIVLTCEAGGLRRRVSGIAAIVDCGAPVPLLPKQLPKSNLVQKLLEKAPLNAFGGLAVIVNGVAVVHDG